MYVLGINNSHDRSAALVQDGEVRVAIAEERLDRLKHSVGVLHKRPDEIGPKVLPWKSIAYCLQTVGLVLEDLDLIVVDQAYAPVDVEKIRAEIPLRDPKKIRALPTPSHHLAHASSAFYCSTFEESAILVMDHIGSLINAEQKESESYFLGVGHEIRLLHKRLTTGRDLEAGSESPANLYRLITLLLGFVSPMIDFGQRGRQLAQYDDAGKTMGLAPYGVERPDWEPWVRILETGGIEFTSLAKWLERKGLLQAVEYPAEEGETPLRLLSLAMRPPGRELMQLHRDLAYKAQQELERAILHFTADLYERTKCPQLCLAGGIALNSVANQKILDQGLFRRLFIQPAATDDGNAVGTALYGYFTLLGGKKRIPLKNVFLGKKYSSEAILTALKKFHLHFPRKFRDSKKLVAFVADRLAEGKVVAWFQGGSEFGPRALGNRSILADPRQAWMRDYLNKEVKSREEFRPFAPAVLQEKVSEYFEFDGDSPYMLLVAPVRREKIEQIPAVTHVDGTARLQTVRREENPLFYDLIDAFGCKTGVPILLNTSFNIRGYPIVETPEDAIWSFLNSKIDWLVMGEYAIAANLYSDEELLVLRPRREVRVEHDDGEPVQYYVNDLQKQKCFSISETRRGLLAACDGGRSVENLGVELRITQEELLREIRALARLQWISLRLPA